MNLDPAVRKLLRRADRYETRLEAVSTQLIAAQYRRLSLDAAEKALSDLLAAPQAKRRRELPRLMRLIDEATSATRTPPDEVWRVVARAVKGRVLSVDELSRLQDSTLKLNDSAELEAGAVARQRRQMNRYWDKEQKRFRDDVAKTVRESLRKGLPHDEAVQLLQRRVGVSASRANLIMLDQQRTAVAYADQRRQKQLGIERFIWHSMGGPTARPEHLKRSGKVYRWNGSIDKPGQAICCRCRALPVPAARSQGELRSFERSEQERIRSGKHVKHVEGASKELQRFVLRGAQLAGLDRYLERNPLASTTFHSALKDMGGYFNGDYSRLKKSIRISVRRIEGEHYGRPFEWGKVETVSASAETAPLSMRRTYVHELGHMLIDRYVEQVGYNAAEKALEPIYKAARSSGRAVSIRALDNWREYFCETLTASVFHEQELLKHDPIGYNAVKKIRAALEVDE